MVRSIGIDSGDRAVHVVELDGGYRKTRLVSAHAAPIGSGDDPSRPDIVADAVREALDNGAKGALALGHPCREAILRTIELPFKGADAIKKVVKAEVEGEIYSHSVEDTVVDFHEIGETATGGTKILVASVPKLGVRNQLTAMSTRGVEPETVDLDTMALWRAADWVGAFEGADDASDGAPAPIHAVVDVGARTVKVLLVEGDHLVDMRVLRLGDNVVCEQIARTYGIHAEQARAAIEESLRTGSDSHVEGVEQPALAAPAEDAAAPGGEGVPQVGDDADAPAEAGAAVVSFSEVKAAHAKFLARLSRELTRFLAATGLSSRIRSVWVSGSSCRSEGVGDMLAEVFGVAPRELDVLAHLAHDLDEAEAAELSPQLAVAVGLGLARMGGPEGFELRQEDLAQQGGFDAIKFPLAIACMVGLLAMFVLANKKSMELRQLEFEIGMQYQDTAMFFGYLNPIFSDDEWLQDKRYFARKGKDGRTTYKFKDLLADVVAAPVHERVGIVRRQMREVARQKQKETGVYEDVSIESGLSVLVRWAEMLKGIEPQLGRYLVPSLELSMKPKSRKLQFRVAFRGEDFRSRMSILQSAIAKEVARPDSPFTQSKEPTPPERLFADRSETGVTGAYFEFTIPIKDSFQPFGPSSRVGALDASPELPGLLAMASKRQEVVR